MIDQKIILDSAIGITAISGPVWISYITTYGGLVMLLGGIVLLVLRIALAWKEWKKPNG